MPHPFFGRLRICSWLRSRHGLRERHPRHRRNISLIQRRRIDRQSRPQPSEAISPRCTTADMQATIGQPRQSTYTNKSNRPLRRPSNPIILHSPFARRIPRENHAAHHIANANHAKNPGLIEEIVLPRHAAYTSIAKRNGTPPNSPGLCPVEPRGTSMDRIMQCKKIRAEPAKPGADGEM